MVHQSAVRWICSDGAHPRHGNRKRVSSEGIPRQTHISGSELATPSWLIYWWLAVVNLTCMVYHKYLPWYCANNSSLTQHQQSDSLVRCTVLLGKKRSSIVKTAWWQRRHFSLYSRGPLHKSHGCAGIGYLQALRALWSQG